jgi:hypothetical protein
MDFGDPARPSQRKSSILIFLKDAHKCENDQKSAQSRGKRDWRRAWRELFLSR